MASPDARPTPDAAPADAPRDRIADLDGLGLIVSDLLAGTAVADGRAADLFGLPADVPLSREAIQARYHTDDRAHVRDQMQAALDPTGDGTATAEMRVVRPDGSTVWLSTRTRVVFEGAGEARRPVRAVLVASDVTAVHAAADRSQVDLQIALDAARLGRWEVDTGARTVFRDARADAFHGLPASDATYPLDEAFAAVHADDRARVAAAFARTEATGETLDEEYRVGPPGGPVRWARATGRAVAPRRIAGVVQDVTAQKENEIALARSRRRLQLSLLAARLGTFEYDPATDHHTADPRTRALLGPDADGSLAAFAEHVHPDDRAAFERFCADALAAEQPMQTEYRRCVPGEPVRWIESTAWARDDGRGLRVVGTVRDVTERREATARLEQSEARFRDLADAAPQLVWTALPDGRVTYYNRRHDLYAGIAPGPDGTWTWAPTVHPDDLARTVAAWDAAVASGTLYDCEHRIRMRDGRYHVHLSRAEPVRDAQGRVEQWYGTATDIHALDAARAALRESEARYRVLMESIDVGFCLFEMLYDDAGAPVDYRFIETNPAFENQTGLVDAVGRTAYSMIPTLERHWVETYAGIAATGEPVRFTNGSDAMGRWFDVYGVRVGGPGSVRVALLFTDVSEQRAAQTVLSESEAALRALADALEDRVRERTAELERSNAELDQFAYVASHDLKAPLRAIDSLAAWIAEDAAAVLPPESARHLALLRGRAERMERLLDSLLTYSRAGRTEATPEPVDTAALVREAVALVAPPEGFDVRLDGTFPTVETARAPLELVVRNLVANAIKHHDRADGCVSVSARTFGGWAEFTVADDGPGVAEAYRERVFGMFQTLRPRDEVEGSGMGLAIVRKTVESRGGRVTLSERAGGGASFRFTWPLRPAP